jgi:glycosyltransferase involved in cell wall biosynthesis
VTGVSLVVPVKDEAGSIERLIRSIQRQLRPPDEVVIVDGGSSDGTVALIRDLVGDDDRYRLVEAGAATPGHGRNLGIDAAVHPWVALTDAGIELDPHWLDRLTRFLEHDASLDVVFGSVAPASNSFFERCADLAYVSAPTASPAGPVGFRSVASCLLRKDVWRRAGGFPDLRAAEDLVFMRRLDALGCRVARAPEARVVWQLQPTIRRTFQRFRRYSMHNVLAGQQRYWHYGIARQYLAATALVVLARAVRRSPLPLLSLATSLRVGRTIWRRREGRGPLWLLRPDRFVAVGAVLAVIDAATFVGWFEAHSVRRRSRREA